MRISDGSSDVCSSDLIGDNGGLLGSLGGLLQNNAMQVAQLATLGFSRSQELEADQLGVRYLKSAGYDPMALSTVLASLANQTNLEAKVARSEERRVGKECGSTCRSRWSPYH